MDAVLYLWTLLPGIQIQSNYLYKHVCDSLLETFLETGHILGTKRVMCLGMTNVNILNIFLTCI